MQTAFPVISMQSKGIKIKMLYASIDSFKSKLESAELRLHFCELWENIIKKIVVLW